jgi:hypothetical protein
MDVGQRDLLEREMQSSLAEMEAFESMTATSSDAVYCKVSNPAVDADRRSRLRIARRLGILDTSTVLPHSNSLIVEPNASAKNSRRYREAWIKRTSSGSPEPTERHGAVSQYLPTMTCR